MATRAAIRQAIFQNLKDDLTGTVSVVNSQTISVPEIVHLPTGELNDSEVYIYSGTGAGQSRRIRTHTQVLADGVGTLLPYANWTTPPNTTSLVEIHKFEYGWTVAKGNEAISQTHQALEDIYLTDVTDETLTMQGGRREYPIPSGLRWLHSVEIDHPADVGTPGSVYDQGALNWGSTYYDQDRGLFSATSQAKLAQVFQVTSGGNPAGFWSGGVALFLRSVGTLPTQTLTVRLETVSGGLPTGTLLDAKATGSIASSVVSGTYRYMQATWTAPVYVPSGTSVAIVVSTSASVDASNYVAWGEDTSTSYPFGSAARYDGSAWSAISGSAFVFAVQSSQLNSRFVPIPQADPNGPLWDVVRGQSVLWVRDPKEGFRLRLKGQGQATAPSADSDNVTIPEAFCIPKATSILLAMQPGGPQTDADARDRWALAHDARAERVLPMCRVQVRPNSKPVALR